VTGNQSSKEDPHAMIHARSTTRARPALAVALALVAALVAAVAAGCGGTSLAGASSGVIAAVGAENEYANVIEQIGGRYVKVTAIESNPNTDPHTFEASTSVAQAVSSASLLIENGVGYDT
jgi:zinc/manganese transport system substrate-binding protein